MRRSCVLRLVPGGAHRASCSGPVARGVRSVTPELLTDRVLRPCWRGVGRGPPAFHRHDEACSAPRRRRAGGATGAWAPGLESWHGSRGEAVCAVASSRRCWWTALLAPQDRDHGGSGHGRGRARTAACRCSGWRGPDFASRSAVFADPGLTCASARERTRRAASGRDPTASLARDRGSAGPERPPGHGQRRPVGRRW
jgi:hypothetical protein